MPKGGISTANVEEVMSRLIRSGASDVAAEANLRKLGLEWIASDERQCLAAGRLHATLRRLKLSYADCACLALATERGEPAVTADQDWKQLSIGVPIILIR